MSDHSQGSLAPSDRPSSRAHPVRLCGQEVPSSGHICAFFDSRAEKYDILGTYFNDAISGGDRVVNIVDAAARDAHLDALRDAHVPVTMAMHSDQLRVMTTEDTYLRDGELSLAAVLDMLRDTLRTAQDERRCVRTCGDMSWIGRTPTASVQAMEYEARVNDLLPTTDCTLLCVYDRSAIPAFLVSDILSTHPYSVIKGKLRANPYYVAPDEYLSMLRGRQQ